MTGVQMGHMGDLVGHHGEQPRQAWIGPAEDAVLEEKAR